MRRSIKMRYLIAMVMAIAAFFFGSDGDAADALSKHSQQKVILGVLEDVPGAYVGEKNSYAIRVVFQKRGENWEAFPSDCTDQNCLKSVTSQYPSELTWHIGFDGRNLGHVTAQTPSAFHFYAGVGLLEITSHNTIPVVGDRSRDYAGDAGRPVYRPLIANTQPYFKDPESWRPVNLSLHQTKLLRRQYRKRFPRLCKSDAHDETKLEPFAYHDEDVEVTKAYASKRGWTLARLHLNEAIDCGDTESGSEIYDQWFTISPQMSIRYLDQGMWLVAAGDYDNTGKDSLVFSIDQNNRGGYELFYDDFKKSLIFEYSYH